MADQDPMNPNLSALEMAEVAKYDPSVIDSPSIPFVFIEYPEHCLRIFWEAIIHYMLTISYYKGESSGILAMWTIKSKVYWPAVWVPYFEYTSLTTEVDDCLDFIMRRKGLSIVDAYRELVHIFRDQCMEMTGEG